MKKSTKIVTGTLIGLAATAVISVGFSSWIINQTNTVEAGNVDVTVADTQDTSFLIDTATATDNKIQFDAEDDRADKTTPLSVITVGDGSACDMQFVVTTTVRVAKQAVSGNLRAKMAIVADAESQADEKLTTILNAGTQVVSPFAALDTYENIATLGESEGAKTLASAKDANSPIAVAVTGPSTISNSDYVSFDVTITCNFKWGSDFGGSNPAVYAEGKNSEQVQAIVQKLRTLKEASGAKLLVTLTTTAA